MLRYAVPVLFVLAACDGSTYQYNGETMGDYFTFDGQRQWKFVNESNAEYLRVVDKEDSVEVSSDGRDIYTLVHSVECMGGGRSAPEPTDSEDTEDTEDTESPSGCTDGEVLLTVRWSANRADGIHIWSYETPSAGVVNFTEPVMVADDPWLVDSVETTETDGITFTSTFEQIGDCAVQWNSNWDGCPSIVLEDGGAGTPIAATYQVQAGYAVVAMDFADEEGVWELLTATWERTD